jgi:hydrogenase maturation protease
MPNPSPLVIGFGNRLRSDDGAGIHLAEQVEAAAPGLAVLTCHQLTPELADAVAAAGAVVFLDATAASPAHSGAAPALLPISASAAGDPFSHVLCPVRLLGLSAALHGRTPPAWELLIPGRHWDVGDQLSHTAASACREALPLLLHWAAQHA